MEDKIYIHLIIDTKMMNRRIIKFRVWNSKTKSWVHGPGQEPHLFGETILLGGFMQGVPLLDLNDCVPLQFTGMLDDDGKEIYEGDIVSYGSDSQRYDSVVAYHKDGFVGHNFFHERDSSWIGVYDALWKRKGADAYFQGYYRTDMQLTGHNYIIVIGNIYENPELL